MKTTRTLGLLAAGVLAAGFAGEAAAQANRNTLTIIRDQDSNNYDPAKTAARAGGEVIYMMSDTLVTLDWDQKTVKPGLATSWTVSPDGKLYTFQIRDDVTFCNGKKMTAEDIAYSIRRWVDPATKGPVASRAGPIKEVRATSPTTLEYELTTPYSELLYQLTLFMASVVDKETVEKLGPDFGVKGFNGTGPFCWVSWEPRNEIVLQRHPTYKWGPDIYQNRGPAKVERVVWKVLPEESTRVAALQTGQADLTQYVPYWAVSQLQKVPSVSVMKAENYFWMYKIGFKIDKPAVADVRIRRAINHAVDQKALAEGVFFGTAEPATTYLDPKIADFDPKVKDVAATYNPEAAKKLLDEAGWKAGPDGFRYKDGQKLTFLTYGLANWQKIFEAVQGDLRKVGIDMQIQVFDGTVGWGKLATQEFDAYGMSFPYVSVTDAYDIYFRSTNTPTPNRMNWKDPESDKLLNEAKGALTPEGRFAAISQLQGKVHQEAVWLPIIHENLFVAANKRVTGVRPHGIYGCGLYKGLDFALAR